jgi:DNA-binding SARP family transcriptional activator
MARLCARALECGIEVDYVRAFVRTHRLMPETPPLGIAAWPWPVEVRALGPLTVRVDGREIAGAGKAQLRPLDLLAALVAFGGRNVSIDRLVDALWPDADGDAARAALDTTVLRLRRLLGDGAAVVVDGGRLSLDTRRCWIDTWAVEDVLNRLDRGGDSDAMASWLDRLAELYRGPLLAERSHAWAMAPRERLRLRVVAQFERMGRSLEAWGDVERALGWYLRGLAADELADGLYLGAARCYRTTGRNRSALALLRHAERLREAAVPDSPSRTA